MKSTTFPACCSCRGIRQATGLERERKKEEKRKKGALEVSLEVGLQLWRGWWNSLCTEVWNWNTHCCIKRPTNECSCFRFMSPLHFMPACSEARVQTLDIKGLLPLDIFHIDKNCFRAWKWSMPPVQIQPAIFPWHVQISPAHIALAGSGYPL